MDSLGIIENWSVESILAFSTRLTYEPYLEPRTRLRKALEEAGIDSEDFQVIASQFQFKFLQ